MTTRRRRKLSGGGSVVMLRPPCDGLLNATDRFGIHPDGGQKAQLTKPNR